jgi:hypothetical protein
MSKKLLDILPIQHTNDGHITLSINGVWYNYWCDNAKILRFLEVLRKRTSNKGKALAVFKREATLLKGETNSGKKSEGMEEKS